MIIANKELLNAFVQKHASAAKPLNFLQQIMSRMAAMYST